MGKYRCSSCGYKFKNMDDIRTCPLCKSDKSLVEIADEFTKKEVKDVIEVEVNKNKAVVIDKDNPSIERIKGCINCGMCMRTCINREKMPDDSKCLVCVGCGQCIITCPKKVLEPKNDIYKFLEAKKRGKKCIATIAPASRVTLGDAFGYEPGMFLEKELVGLLKSLGFDYVYDVAYGADLTIMEEASELLWRINNNGVLPMISSCCPSWVRYAEVFYPDILKHLSTCKSPISMLSSTIKEYLPRIKNIKKEDIFIVSITPCTAKKWEITKPDMKDTDAIITVAELVNYVKNKKIDLNNIKKEDFDGFFGKSSGAGLIFGNTGGVTEAVLRMILKLSGSNSKKVVFNEVRGYNCLKEAVIDIGFKKLKVAVIDEMANAKIVLDEIRNNNCQYDFIEIMNCRGGCIGGGGNCSYKLFEEEKIKLKRIETLYNKDKDMCIRLASDNPFIKEIYDNLYKEPLSDIAYKLLHTDYCDRSFENKNINN